jgi:hypothetical protein
MSVFEPEREYESGGCEVCGRPVEVVRLSDAAPILCDLHAWTLREEQAKRAQKGRKPPAEAYQEVELEERWGLRQF